MPRLNKNHTQVIYQSGEYRVFFDGIELPEIHPYHEGIRKLFGGEAYGVIVKVQTSDTVQQDGQVWRTLAKSKHRDHFVPVLEYGTCNKHTWVCQPFVKLAWEWSERRQHEDFIMDLADSHNIGDMHSGNWAVEAELNIPVIFDYGL